MKIIFAPVLALAVGISFWPAEVGSAPLLGPQSTGENLLELIAAKSKTKRKRKARKKRIRFVPAGMDVGGLPSDWPGPRGKGKRPQRDGGAHGGG
jgi:hypothetical protein